MKTAILSNVTQYTKLLLVLCRTAFTPHNRTVEVRPGRMFACANDMEMDLTEEFTAALKMNLDAIGPYCSGLGILRSMIADGVPMPSVRLDLSRGAVGEIADVYSCAHDLLNTLFMDKSAEEWKDVVKKSQGAPFRDNLQKCIMQLVGELDVPTTKVSKVAQSVSKWLYDKDIDKSELPSTATANNYVDIAQVLGKYQLAEELVESDIWDLYGDGTSRDTKKIVG